jgi:hypothetical protein
MVATGETASLLYLKDACTRLDNQIRPPPFDQLAKAWTTFVRERDAKKGTLSDVEAVYTRRIFELLKEAKGEQFETLITSDSIKWALDCIPVTDGPLQEGAAAQAFSALSLALFDEADTRAKSDTAAAEWSQKAGNGQTVYETFWLKHLEILTNFGLANEARNAIAQSGLPKAVITAAWASFLRHLARGNISLTDSNSLPLAIEKQISPLSTGLKASIAEFYASMGNMAKAKEFATFEDKNGKFIVHAQYIGTLLNACRKHNDLEWGRYIIKTITSNTEAMKKDQHLWNVLFTWALATGKSVDEINRMMEVMVRTNPSFAPTIQDINSLIKIANEKNDPYLAERLVTLGGKWGIRANEETYLLQMDYRLSISDIDGARTAFDFVRSFQGESNGEVDAAPRVNALIQAMCTGSRKTYAFDTIMSTVDFLGERSLAFAAPTVAALTILHLQRDEFTDVADLLTTHMKSFSQSERALVRQALLELMLAPETSLPRLWDTYMIFQAVFEESPRSDRIAIMQRFFERARPDMAIHVFNHMRRHPSPAINPDTETYVTALIGCGRANDDESLSVVNNVLKLDLRVEETTRLHNARMIAFFGTGESEKAQAVWEDIIRSDEGPSRNSLLLVFRICEQSAFGEVRARDVWSMVRRMDVPLDEEIVAAYVGALAGNGRDEEARRVVETCEEELGVEVGEMM